MDEQTTAPANSQPDPEPGVSGPDGRQGQGAAADLRAELDASAARQAALLARLREAVLAAEPALPPELVHGATLEELEANAEAARAAVRHVRAAVASEAPPVPAGAPGRVAPQPLSPWEKIRAGMARL